MDKKTETKVRDLIQELVIIKAEAFKLGLPKTGHALDVATTTIGWEFAEQLEKEPNNE